MSVKFYRLILFVIQVTWAHQFYAVQYIQDNRAKDGDSIPLSLTDTSARSLVQAQIKTIPSPIDTIWGRFALDDSGHIVLFTIRTQELRACSEIQFQSPRKVIEKHSYIDLRDGVKRVEISTYRIRSQGIERNSRDDLEIVKEYFEGYELLANSDFRTWRLFNLHCKKSKCDDGEYYYPGLPQNVSSQSHPTPPFPLDCQYLLTGH